jgi:hypothetical protein
MNLRASHEVWKLVVKMRAPDTDGEGAIDALQAWFDGLRSSADQAEASCAECGNEPAEVRYCRTCGEKADRALDAADNKRADAPDVETMATIGALRSMLGRLLDAHDGSHNESCEAFGHGEDAEQMAQAEEGDADDYCDCGGIKLRQEARGLLLLTAPCASVPALTHHCDGLDGAEVITINGVTYVASKEARSCSQPSSSAQSSEGAPLSSSSSSTESVPKARPGGRLADGWTVCRRVDTGAQPTRHEWLADHRGGTGADVLEWTTDAAKAWRMTRGDAESYRTISYMPAWTEWLGEATDSVSAEPEKKT